MSQQNRPQGEPVEDPRTTAVLMLVAIHEASAHLGKLLRLARTEIRGNLRAVASLVLLFGGALLLVVAALVLLLFALRDALAVLIGSETGAALIVALPFVLASAILSVWAQRLWSRPSVEG
ncbi:hypothetical protein LPLAFNJD_LOCUS3145 [Methylorubrum aminovorans]